MNTGKGSYKIVTGDATNPTLAPNELAIIPHITNNAGAGAGFVKAIDDRWPGMITQKYCNWLWSRKSKSYNVASPKSRPLGSVQFYKPIKNGQIMLANMVAQDNAGTALLGASFPSIRYVALVACMKKVREKIASIQTLHTIKHFRNATSFSQAKPHLNISIHCPFFGSGIAGGSWEVIEQLIHEIWIRYGIDVTAYKLPVKVQPPVATPSKLVFSLEDDEAVMAFNKMHNRLPGQELRIKLPEISHSNNP